MEFGYRAAWVWGGARSDFLAQQVKGHSCGSTFLTRIHRHHLQLHVLVFPNLMICPQAKTKRRRNPFINLYGF